MGGAVARSLAAGTGVPGELEAVAAGAATGEVVMYEKWVIGCGRPFSMISKSSPLRSVTCLPSRSVTVASTCTRLVVIRTTSASSSFCRSGVGTVADGGLGCGGGAGSDCRVAEGDDAGDAEGDCTRCCPTTLINKARVRAKAIKGP